MSDISQQLVDRVISARGKGEKLSISGRGSKSFLGREIQGEKLSLAAHTGIVNYHPVNRLHFPERQALVVPLPATCRVLAVPGTARCGIWCLALSSLMAGESISTLADR